ncbi:hypothetical protein [Deinococcus arenicola]|uniref:Bacterial Ig-like domain-containing protein n=1 Tax=Deinococcus arenicola TaxID=2994950 RepID=A0ABU4DVW3_9DEIO|nr:hypothetical protein [Deinococcus sp. ZS9-10]MDV6376587.1 hypothetical protein [Deinococcus sp. ZS9-10]
MGLENTAPYVIAGDQDGGRDILPWNLPPDGPHTFTVTGYFNDSTTGTADTPLTLKFTVRR